jgi:hypothetical protein
LLTGRVAAAALAVALLAVGSAAASIAAPLSTASAAPRPICVGLVVDGTSAGGSMTSGCVRVPPGDSGLDVLEASGHEVTTRNGGAFVCSIDGVPANGCSDIDADHYWAYWHRAAGASAWTYSDEGAASYDPPAGSSDGWVYDNGSSRRPTGIGRLCPQPAPTPSPSAPSKRSASAAPVAPVPPAASSPPQSSPVAPETTAPMTGPAAASTPAGAVTATAPRPPSRRHRSGGPRQRGHSRSRHARDSAPIAAVAPAHPPTLGEAPIWQVALALVLVGGLAAAAWVRARRHRG